ncbi:MAG: preprotein translocase subunit SecY [Myxococcota bacterium]|nr:preprotein translocase subunit SecY [Myxococcota bacterium]
MAHIDYKRIPKVPELRKRLIFTVAMLAVYRVGVYISIPGMNRDAMKAYLGSQDTGVGGFLNMFNFLAGGALEQLSIFALGIMPYITASIILQVAGVLVPSLERLKKEGDAGRKRINQLTRYGTLLLAVVQGTALARGLNALTGQQNVVTSTSAGSIALIVLTLTAGTAFLMWLGEEITAKGVGNGISLLIMAGIVAGLPSAIHDTLRNAFSDATAFGPVDLLILIVVMAGIVAAIVYVERAQRRLPVQYARRAVGGGMVTSQNSHLPLKVNTSGVIPPIFASSLMMFPGMVSGYFGPEFQASVQGYLAPGQWMYLVIYSGLIIFFAFFYTDIMFNPVDMSDNLKKWGGFIPGVRPGEPTAKYIGWVLKRITTGGSLYLTVVCLVPYWVTDAFQGVNFYFGGTGLLIIVGVSLDLVTQIQSHLISANYDQFSLDNERPRLQARLDEAEPQT